MYTTSECGGEEVLLFMGRDPGVVVVPALDMVGGVWWPPVKMLDELDSSPSLSYMCDGDLSPRVPFIFCDKQNCVRKRQRVL